MRALWYMVVLGVAVYVSVWMADHSGSVTLRWQGLRVDTSFAVLLAAVAAIAAAAALLYRMWIYLRRAPARIGRLRTDGRRRRGYLALTRGMVAVAAGDGEEAGQQVKRADVLLDDPPLTMLLAAQSAQLNGDERAAGKFFNAMLERPETEFLGLRGLFAQAIKKDNRSEALKLARRAHDLKPKSEWVATNLFDLQTHAGQWSDAVATLDESVKKRLVRAADGRRRKAVLCYQLSLEAADRGESAESLKRLRKAHGEDPGFVPAASRLARLLAEAGKVRKACGVIEKAWSNQPHPALLEPYWTASRAEDGMGKMVAAQRLEKINPDHVESHLAVAQAAVEAQLWGEARKHLEVAAGDDPTARVCRLMAQLEEAEHGDHEGARQWLLRASLADPDPAWVCGHCGNASAEWSVLCGNCDSFASFSWRTPPHVVSLAGQEAPKALLPAIDEADTG